MTGITVKFESNQCEEFDDQHQLLLSQLEANMRSLIHLYQFEENNNVKCELDEFQLSLLNKCNHTTIIKIQEYINKNKHQAFFKSHMVKVLHEIITNNESCSLFHKSRFVHTSWLLDYLLLTELDCYDFDTKKMIYDIAKEMGKADRVACKLMNDIRLRIDDLNKQIIDCSHNMSSAIMCPSTLLCGGVGLTFILLEHSLDIMKVYNDELTSVVLYTTFIHYFNEMLINRLKSRFEKSAISEYVYDSETQNELGKSLIDQTTHLLLSLSSYVMIISLINMFFSKSKIKDNVLHLSDLAFSLEFLVRSCQIMSYCTDKATSENNFDALMCLRQDAANKYLELKRMIDSEYKTEKIENVYDSFVVLHLKNWGRLVLFMMAFSRGAMLLLSMSDTKDTLDEELGDSRLLLMLVLACSTAGYIFFSVNPKHREMGRDAVIYLASSVYFGVSKKINQDSYGVSQHNSTNLTKLSRVFSAVCILISVIASHRRCEYAIPIDSINKISMNRPLSDEPGSESDTVDHYPGFNYEHKL